MMGPGIWHLHCSDCRIEIHGYHTQNIIKHFNLHHTPNTYLVIKDNRVHGIIDGEEIEYIDEEA